MDKVRMKKITLRLLGSLLLAGILAVIVDLAVAWQGVEVPCSMFLLAAAGMAVVFFLLSRRKYKWPGKTGLWLLALILIASGTLFGCWKLFTDSGAFENVDLGKESLYGDRKVMVIVPHQDDEINILGGVLEEYVRYGSDVYPVFVTNGDSEGLAEERFREALDVSAAIGIPEENVIFLGYGDTWKAGGPHLYNAESEQVLESALGKTAAYGTESAKVWREGAAYTRENLLADIQSVIEVYRPDVIYCVDYDYHIDHRAVSLAFEKVMGTILQQDPDYKPLVFKAYAYKTAWYAEPDFFGINLTSTANVFGDPHYQSPENYRWEERIRLPVAAESLSRSLFSCGTYETLALYESQEASFQAARIINGDKVAWFRSTDSLCYQAQVHTNSGNGALLNDFMLMDNLDLADPDHMPYDGVWVPEEADKRAEFRFNRSMDVTFLRLYDNPSPADNVLAGKIVFSDGTEMQFGPLDPNGAAMTLYVGEKYVTGFTVVLTETEGARAGLTEVEAFEKVPDHGMKFIKLTDAEGNFLYDYWLPEKSEAYLDLYYQSISEDGAHKLVLSWDNKDCWAERSEDKIWVIVPEGKTMTLTVTVEGSHISDTIRIHNPGKLERLQCTVSQLLEQQLFQKYCDGYHRNSATYKLFMTALDLIGV